MPYDQVTTILVDKGDIFSIHFTEAQTDLKLNPSSKDVNVQLDADFANLFCLSCNLSATL